MAENATKPLPKEIAGIRIPDSKIAVEATEVAREASSPPLFNHVLRSYIFAELVGRRMNVRYDSELLYIAAVLHDLGLTERYQGAGRFEVDGADAAAQFLSARGVLKDRVDLVWDAIALHSSFGIADRKQPEIALVFFGTGVDVGGVMLDQIPPEALEHVIEAYPRLGFKKAFLEAIAEVVRKKPQTAFFTFQAGIGRRYVPGFEEPNACDLITNAPFLE
jgi:hypothetical protein